MGMNVLMCMSRPVGWQINRHMQLRLDYFLNDTSNKQGYLSSPTVCIPKSWYQKHNSVGLIWKSSKISVEKVTVYRVNIAAV